MGGSGIVVDCVEDDESNVSFMCWGENGEGQLGISSRSNRIISELIPNGTSSNVLFSTGDKHTCAIYTGGSRGNLACWGDNDSGQLGNSSNDDLIYEFQSGSRVNLDSGKTAVAVSAGGVHTCAILNDNKVMCWGKGGSGRLGNGASTDQNAPVAVSMSSNTAEAISAGGRHTCAIFDDDKVYCWGENGSGQLGIGSTTDQNAPTVVNLGTDKTAAAIRTGSNHTCALLNDNTVKCWGANSNGQVGDRSTTDRTSPVAVPLGSGRTATAIHAKGNYTCAILDDGSLLCWGANNRGQLGDGTTTNRDTPVAVDLGEGRTAQKIGGGLIHTCAVLDDESTKCWGHNYYGQTGLPTAHRGDQPGEMGENLALVDLDIDKEEEVPEIVLALGQHSCFIGGDGVLSCWGRDNTGQVGVGLRTQRDCTYSDGTKEHCTKVPAVVSLGTNRTAIDVGVGSSHTCAVLDDGSVKCWGSNGDGQVGSSGGHIFSTPVAANLGTNNAVEIELGANHTCAILEGGSVQCWGLNNYGQLGVNDTTDRSSPANVTFAEGRSAMAIELGSQHSCALLDDNSLVCWGSNNDGQLGAVTSTTCRISNRNRQCSQDPHVVDLGQNTVTAMDVGHQHTCAVLDDNSLKCWGNNSYGQLGKGDSLGTETPTNVNLGTDTALAVATGEWHTCAILDDNSVKCWGYNVDGRLGDGTTTARNTPVAVTLPSGRSAVSIYGGANHTCALLDDNAFYCWGGNHLGELNDGTTINRYRPARARF